MRRRTILAGAASLLPLALAGCVGSPGPDGVGADGGDPSDADGPGDAETRTPDDTETSEPSDAETGTEVEAPNGSTATLVRRERCPNPGEATVEFGDGSVTVVGCVVGKNGCTVPQLLDFPYDEAADELTVVVAAVEERDENEACTEALVNLGYEVAVDFGGGAPAAVRVVHDDVDGRRTVADVTR